MSALQSKVLKPCLRCENENFSLEKINSLAAEIKLEPSLAANKDEYNKRLAACKSCEALREEVLCFHCGCFTAVRARAAKNYCPHPAGDKWLLTMSSEQVAGSR